MKEKICSFFGHRDVNITTKVLRGIMSLTQYLCFLLNYDLMWLIFSIFPFNNSFSTFISSREGVGR